MNNIDQKIRQALSEEDRRELDQLGDSFDPLSLAVLSFKGSQRFNTVLLWLGGFGIFALLVYCGFRYFAVDDLKDSLSWGIAIVLCGMGMVIVKVTSWQLMQTQILTREIKRLELRMLSLQK